MYSSKFQCDKCAYQPLTTPTPAAPMPTTPSTGCEDVGICATARKFKYGYSCATLRKTKCAGYDKNGCNASRDCCVCGGGSTGEAAIKAKETAAKEAATKENAVKEAEKAKVTQEKADKAAAELATKEKTTKEQDEKEKVKQKELKTKQDEMLQKQHEKAAKASEKKGKEAEDKEKTSKAEKKQ